MTIRVAINGYGRIGRNVLRALYEGSLTEQIKIVAINDLSEHKVKHHLTQFDSIHGRFNADVSLDEEHLVVNGDRMLLLQQPDASILPWAELEIDVVLECSGFYADGHKAQAHLDAGATKVIISAPAKNVDATVVYGVNQQTLTGNERIISNASCTTNCLAPVAQTLHQLVGIESGSMTTIHAVTNDQSVTDVSHSDLYRARSGMLSMIPTKTGAASAVSLSLIHI